MKVFEKIKKIGKRCKVVVATAAAAVVGVVSSVCASAATTEASGIDMAKTLSEAGTQMTNQFGTLVADSGYHRYSYSWSCDLRYHAADQAC